MASSSRADLIIPAPDPFAHTWFADEYDIKEELGRGGFSIVKRCVHKSTGKEIAAKIYDIRKLTARDFCKLEREVRICQKLKHPNIVHLYKTIEEPNYHYLIFDLLAGGELFDDIVAREYYGEADAANCMYQILASLNFCHQNDIVHRDVKPENLLLERRGPGSKIKLADFGLALQLLSDEPKWYGFSGTPGYLSPEVVNKEPYAKAVDVWACGVILYILLIGYPPFWDDDQYKLYNQIKVADYCYPSPEWDSITSDAKNLIDSMLVIDQTQRITIDEALRHPFIAQRERLLSRNIHRKDTVESLRKFNARRKLKGVIITTIAVKRALNTLTATAAAATAAAEAATAAETAAVAAAAAAAASKSAASKSAATSASTSTSRVSVQDTMKQTSSNNAPTTTDPAEIFKLTMQEQIINVTEQLLESIDSGNYLNYIKYCAPHLTTFAPETLGNIVEGTEFHKFYFEMYTTERTYKVVNSKIINPHVHILNENAACIVYVRLTQYMDKNGELHTNQAEETRVWQRNPTENCWKNVHFHRSNIGKYKKGTALEEMSLL